jgi:hypothetical protein
MATNNWSIKMRLQKKTEKQRALICERLYNKIKLHVRYTDYSHTYGPFFDGYTTKGLRLIRRAERLQPDFWHY